jgi:hypothetical protein
LTGVDFSLLQFTSIEFDKRQCHKKIQYGVSLLWEAVMVEELPENFCDRVMGLIPEPGERETWSLEAVAIVLVKTKLIEKIKCVT